MRLPSLGLLAAVLAALPMTAFAQDKAAPPTCTAAPGVLLAGDGATWKAIKPGEAVPTDSTLVALFDAVLRSGDGGVTVRLVTDVAQRGPLPILETAVRLHADAKHDLALTPLRGLVVLTNTKKAGPAVVRLGSGDATVELTLKEPGAKLGLEVYSRHAPGTPQLDDPKLDVPVKHLFFICVAGECFLRHDETGFALHAPPGPAVLVWDSLLRQPEVTRLEELPPEVAAMKKDQPALDAINAWAAKLVGADRGKVLAAGVNLPEAAERRAAVIAMGALDDLPALLGVLGGAKQPDARADAVLALRHWLGRTAGQTAKLHAALLKDGYTDPQARSVLQLLYGFTPEQRRDPDTYDVLLDDLKHSKPAVRELAHWHLVRLAPAGKAIPFDALAPAAPRQAAYEAWRMLIPAGKLPPPAKTGAAP